MRRKDKEIKNKVEIEDIIRKAEICHIAVCDGDTPYVFPVNFGYGKNCLFIHSALEGRKIDILRKNDKVCFQMETDLELNKSDTVCDWEMKYRCVIGYGKAKFLEGTEEKREALKILLEHYSDKEVEIPIEKVDSVKMIKVEIESMTGKKAGYL